MVERNQKEQMKNDIERTGTPAIAVQRVVRRIMSLIGELLFTNVALFCDRCNHAEGFYSIARGEKDEWTCKACGFKIRRNPPNEKVLRAKLE